jgi:hypothetical protein
LRGEFQALYLGQDDPALQPDSFGLGSGDLRTSFLTGETADPGIFAGGFPGENASFLDAAAAGRLAAGSVTRLLQ